ncbi:MAG: C40 family peptidase [Gemmatimonadales bacterium]|nr:C40 family peptidase [Gemmatimonadales bacterium]
MIREMALGLALGAGATDLVAAQGLEGRIGRFYDAGGWTLYRVGLSRPLGGIFGLGYHGDYFRREGGSAGGFAGAGIDLTAFRTGAEGPYLVAGLGGGLGSPTSNRFSEPWGSWSAGAGYDLSPASFISVGVEGRWRKLSIGSHDGFELAAGLALRFGGRPDRPPPTPRAPLPPAGSPSSLPSAAVDSPRAPAALADSVIATAAEAMGRPYRYGGTGENGGGFDCSGLIQYAYGRHGVELPRRSVEQAREGKAVRKKLDALAPGDLLTFSNRGKTVTHVGMYIGEGRFIHSATRGVQVSALSAEDPYGRWWYKRWVGVRRIVPAPR